MQKYLSPSLKTDFKNLPYRTNPEMVELLKNINKIVELYSYGIFCLFAIVAVLYLILLIVSPEPNFKEIVDIGNQGTIFLATIAVLTFAYATASEYPEKREILRSGKYFFKSVLIFVIGVILSISSRKALMNPYNTLGLPQLVDYTGAIFIFLLLILGFAFLIVSAIIFASGIARLFKSLQNKQD